MGTGTTGAQRPTLTAVGFFEKVTGQAVLGPPETLIRHQLLEHAGDACPLFLGVRFINDSTMETRSQLTSSSKEVLVL